MADEEILKEESIKDSLESEDIASKINPQIKILKNIGMKQPENVSNGSIIIQENEAEIKENKGIITVKSKDIPVSKKPKKETEWNINYKQLFYSYQIIIAVLILLF